MLEPLVRWWTSTYHLLIKVPIVETPRFDGTRDVDASFQAAIDEKIDEVLERWGVPTLRLHRERRERWASDSLEAILPLLGPVQEPLFKEDAES